MLILTVVATPKEGLAAELRQACADLETASADHEGLVSYTWHAKDDSGALTLVEVHENEASIFNHIQLADTSALGAAAAAFTDINLYGPSPSAEVRTLLGGFGDLTVHEKI